MLDDRIRTYVSGFDELMEGGVPARSVVLVCGRTGAMKSTLCYSILYYNALKRKKCGTYLSLKQTRVSLLEHMSKLGMDLSTLKKMSPDAILPIVDMARLKKEDTGRHVNWIDNLLTTVQYYKEKYACDLFAIDSLTDLHSLTMLKSPRRDINTFFEKLRELNVTTFIISNIPDPDKQFFGVFGFEEILADGIIHIEMERVGKRINQFLSVVKMRNTKHDRSYFPLIFENAKFEVVTE